MINPKIFSVGQINRYIKNMLENDFILSSLLVKGEISNFKHHSSGHLYFTLKDSGGVISCVMFHQDARMMPFELENGMEVVVYGHVSLYEKTGQYQLYAEMIEPLGMGALQIAFEQLKQKLSSEGLFDSDFKRELPTSIETIAIVTSPTGAAVRDMIQIAKRRDYRVNIAIFPSLVQGAEAPADIVRNIKLANEWGKADVLIVGRGGGSIEDLWAFNSEEVARAIFASDLPVISAVGHEVDFTIADFVADMRAPTPSAAAELATEERTSREVKFQQLLRRLEKNTNDILNVEKKRFFDMLARPKLKRPLEHIYDTQLYLSKNTSRLHKNMEQLLMMQTKSVSNLEARIFAASPFQIMKRGYAIAEIDGTPITSVAQTKVGDDVSLRFLDGWITAEVKEKVVANNNGKEEVEL